MQTFILKYSDSCFISLTKNISKAVKGCSKSDVHILRLNIKKIWTILAILEKENTVLKESKTLNKVDKIFLHSGNLRDIQVESALLKSFKNPKDLYVKKIINSFKKKKNEGKDNLVKQLNKIDPFEVILLNQQVSEIIENIDKKDIEDNCKLYLQQLLSELMNKTKVDINEKSLHSIRILLKDLISILLLLKESKQNFQIDPKFAAYINSIQKKLGKWHDISVLLEKVRVMNNRKFESIQQLIGDDKKALQSKIIARLNKFQELEPRFEFT